MKEPIVRSIDVGFGTTSVVTSVQGDGNIVIRTMPSIAVPVDIGKRDISAGSLSASRNIQVSVRGNLFEVGEDVASACDPRSTRVLNSGYITSDQYLALFHGALSMMELPPSDTIDLLVGGLPVTGMGRREELRAMMIGEHKIGDRVIRVKDAWVIAQPVAGLLSYYREAGMAAMSALQEETILVVDPGYLTFDWAVVKRLIINDKRSGAVELGMSKVLAAVADAGGPIFGVDVLDIDTVDAAFISTPPRLRIFGRQYPFPVCEGKDLSGNRCDITYDFRERIRRPCREAAEAMRSSVGDGQDLDRIVVVGGPAHVYAPAIQSIFPKHQVQVTHGHLQSVVTGMQFGGMQRAVAALKKAS